MSKLKGKDGDAHGTEGITPQSFDDLSSRASYYRDKLIREFHILDHVENNGAVSTLPPQVGSKVMSNPAVKQRMLIDAPTQLVKFSIETTKPNPHTESDGEKSKDKRLLKIKNKGRVPLATWAHWVVNSSLWNRCIIGTIVLNCLIIFLMAEYDEEKHLQYVLLMVLDILDTACLVMYSTEIMLKWADNFATYWLSFENALDFCITVMSIVPVILEDQFAIENESSKGIATVGTTLRTVRILRIVGLIFRYGPLRIIVLTVIQALKSMVWIMVLILLMMYIFSVIFMTLFEKYTLADNDSFLYQYAFRSMWSSLITCFQLLTFDHWFPLVHEVASELGSLYLPGIFILMWVILGGFIFRNVFVGVMVNNFHVMSSIMQRQKKEMAMTEKREQLQNRLHAELEREMAEQRELEAAAVDVDVQRKPKVESNSVMQGSESSSSSKAQEEAQEENETSDNLKRTSVEDLKHDLNEFVTNAQNEAENWEIFVADNFLALHGDAKDAHWPKDLLFRYLTTLERLQENMKEYEELQTLATMAILNLHEA